MCVQVEGNIFFPKEGTTCIHTSKDPSAFFIDDLLGDCIFGSKSIVFSQHCNKDISFHSSVMVK